ncbi:MAG: surface lipoprotein assembly modifier [Burkholderiales bacterium]|nr:surface lipoprotein assembly modifier [Burkholderiales bacterium]
MLAVGLPMLLAAPALATPADDIKSLMEAGRAAEAYALGKKHPEALGDPAFDFYFGIAAIDTGHAGEGVLALERYLLNFPDNVSARLQLARGYFALGEDARAREEFAGVLRLGPPPDVVATIERYLDAIRLRETRYRTSTGAFVEAGIGYDSNVNGGVANANISLPGLGPVIIAQAGRKQSDGFGWLAAGGYVSHPIAPGVALFGNGQVDSKLNFSESRFDQSNVYASGGVSYRQEESLFRLGANFTNLWVDDDDFRSTYGATGEWLYQIDEQQSAGLIGQYARLDYSGNQSPRDADYWGAIGTYRKLFSHAWQPIVSLALTAGTEDTRRHRPDLVRDLYGGRIGVSFTPQAKWGVSIAYGHLRSDYKGPDALLGVTRKDKYDAVDASVTYLYTKQLSFKGEVLFSKNDSNIELYEFPRDLALFKVRYAFE